MTENREFFECLDCGATHVDNCRCDEDDLDCTHCGGDGTCDANADPLWDCDEMPHACHACGGSGNRSDQRIF